MRVLRSSVQPICQDDARSCGREERQTLAARCLCALWLSALWRFRVYGSCVWHVTSTFALSGRAEGLAMVLAQVRMDACISVMASSRQGLAEGHDSSTYFEGGGNRLKKSLGLLSLPLFRSPPYE